jgi:hypothetical protein
MFKTRYTATTEGSRTVVRRVGPPSKSPVVRGASPSLMEGAPPSTRRRAERGRRRKKQDPKAGD